MKRFTIVTFLVACVLFVNTLFAQQQLAVNNTVNPLRSSAASYNHTVIDPISTTPAANTGEVNILSEKTLAMLEYIKSDQYVFDNLSSLKKLYTIPNIYFDLDQASITEDAEETLKDLADLLTQQSQVKVAVTAHCDSRMPAYNTSLGMKRATAAKDFLISRGVDESRIVIEKHGRPNAINLCSANPGCSIAEQKLNRGTEFNIIVNEQNLAHLSAYGE